MNPATLFCGRRGSALLLAIFTWFAMSSAALAGNEITHLLQGEEPPSGVVFEIAEADEDALSWALPRVRSHIQQLRNRFPGLDIAVVTHGKEEFLLQSKYRKDNPEVHQAAQDILTGQDVQVHVCGAHAGWYGINEDDFPDYVDVVPAGPIQIDQYRELGYEVIRVEEPD